MSALKRLRLFRLTDSGTADQRTTALDGSDRLYGHRDGSARGFWFRPSVLEQPPISVRTLLIGDDALSSSMSTLYSLTHTVTTAQGTSVVRIDYDATAIVGCPDGEGSRVDSYLDFQLLVDSNSFWHYPTLGMELPTLANPGVVTVNLRGRVVVTAFVNRSPGSLSLVVKARYVNAVSAALYNQRLHITTMPGATYDGP